MLVLIDNYDSFTYNLVQYFGELGEEATVFRNDEVTIKNIEKLSPKMLVISPGPCSPKEAGISVDVIKYFAGKVPIFGVCLGHQAIGYAFGADIVRAKCLMHGKVSEIFHDSKGIFKRIENPFSATRYHSLAIKKETLSDGFVISAWTQDGEIMGIRHKNMVIEGVQFHPESILTKPGKKLLTNFINISKKFWEDK